MIACSRQVQAPCWRGCMGTGVAAAEATPPPDPLRLSPILGSRGAARRTSQQQSGVHGGRSRSATIIASAAATINNMPPASVLPAGIARRNPLSPRSMPSFRIVGNPHPIPHRWHRVVARRSYGNAAEGRCRGALAAYFDLEPGKDLDDLCPLRRTLIGLLPKRLAHLKRSVRSGKVIAAF